MALTEQNFLEIAAGPALGYAKAKELEVFYNSNFTTEAISADNAALDPKIGVSYLTISGSKAFTLASGSFVGQKKAVECVSAAATPIGTLTLADAYASEPTVHKFTAAGQRLVFEWTSTGWKMIDKVRAGTQVAVIGTTVLTSFDMALLYDAQVTGTVVSDTTKSLPDGTLPGERVYVGCSVAAATPIGQLNGTFLTLGSAAATQLQAIGATTDTVSLEWTGTKWLVVANSGITVA